ncbi:unnamed protein product [Hermetia illucens]|uniref:Odorant receptor n=2 Tax=Hermetia illucens TaxID=343691 RepID=A0A7R8UBP0_HERIL|nr:unnamed protein product [Hermetia illucens]
MKSQEKSVKFRDFMGIAVVCYESLGIDAFAPQGKRNILGKIFQVFIFVLGTGNLFLAAVLEIVYFTKSFGVFKDIIEITALLPCTIISTASTNWAYPIIYLHQSYAGYVAVGAGIATDLLLCCIITQLQMHFDFISRQLLEMVPRGGPNDMRCLKQLIQHHVTILRFSEETNDVFGISSLCTFLSSSPIICFTGFQVSIGAANRVIGKYILFLIHQSLTVFAVCYHGNIVIDSSLEVADAAYGQHWFQASKEYKKMLLILITRANNPSTLKATSFVTASLMTFSSIISTSYQFFALVRTMYSDG